MRVSAIRSAAIAGVILCGCLGSNPTPGRQYEMQTASRPRVSVINNNWADVNVALIVGSVPYTLGRVNGFQSRSFEVPGAMHISRVRFLIRALGARSEYLTQEITLEGTGRSVELRVGARLSGSEVVIR